MGGLATSTAWGRQLSAGVTTLVLLWGFATISLVGSGAASADSSCPGLMVYGVQGTGQSSPDADPTQDAGFLSQILGPVAVAAAKDGGKQLVDRAYVPYDAGFGGAVAGGQMPYERSVDGAVAKTESWIKEKAAACPDTKYGLVGYSQGAHVARIVLNDIVTGKTAIKSDDLALVANLGDPGRPQGAPLFPGRPGQVTPSPVPGTPGDAVSKVVASLPSTTPQGGGIAPQTDTDDKSYEKIAGRYLSSCTAGDLSCDAPSDAPLAHLVANIAGQSELNPNDPIGSLGTIAEALATTTVKTAVPIINEDVQAPENNLASLSFEPKQTLSQRLATASDPRTPLPSVSDAFAAVMKVGTIGFNAVKTVIQTVATPETIGQLAVAGATNPLAVVGVLAEKAGEAAVALVPPATQKRLVSNAFDSFKAEIGANKNLFEVSSLLKYWDAAKQHSSYGEVAATPTGKPATQLIADWIIAAARDIAGLGDSGSVSGSVTPTSRSGLPGFLGGDGDGTSTTTARSSTTRSSSVSTSATTGSKLPGFLGGDTTTTTTPTTTTTTSGTEPEDSDGDSSPPALQGDEQ